MTVQRLRDGTAETESVADADDAGAGTKPLRADAARNRQKLIEVATRRSLITGSTSRWTRSPREAGVGIGTLYRHFPTRCDLVLAVYGDQVDALEQRSRVLPTQLPPGEALHEWMRGFVDYYAVKMGLVNLLRSMMQGQPETFERARQSCAIRPSGSSQPAIDAGVVRADATARGADPRPRRRSAWPPRRRRARRPRSPSSTWSTTACASAPPTPTPTPEPRHSDTHGTGIRVCPHPHQSAVSPAPEHATCRVRWALSAQGAAYRAFSDPARDPPPVTRRATEP